MRLKKWIEGDRDPFCGQACGGERRVDTETSSSSLLLKSGQVVLTLSVIVVMVVVIVSVKSST